MLIRQTFLYLPAQILGPLFQFAAIITWTYWLDPEGMGIFALVTATQELSYLVLMSWFSFYALRYFPAADTAAKKRIFYSTENIVLVASSIIISLLALGYYAFTKNEMYTPQFLLIVVAYILSRGLNVHFSERARADHKILAYSLLQITGPVLGLGLGVLAVVFLEASPASVFAGYALAQGVALVIALPLMGTALVLDVPERAIVKQALGYGLPLLAAGALVWVAMNGIRFVVEFERGAAAVGLLMVGLGLGQRAASFAAMFVTAAAFPLAVKRAREEGEAGGLRQLRDSGALLAAVLLPTVGGIAVLNQHIVEVLVAQPFQAMTIAVLPFAIAAGALRNFRTHFTDQAYLLFERPGMIVVIDGVDAFFSIVFCWIGLLMGGLVGAVAGILLGAAVGVILSLGMSMVSYGLRLPFVHMARIFIATLVMVAVIRLVALDGGAWHLLGEIIVGAAVYGLAMAAMYYKLLFRELRALEQRAFK
jgi:O-antigen/teichoic acid export membrane protein